ncbi:MAG: histidine phosphatase family protein [Candidatus Endonucleobacter sp. (ex Gigantidas childressi)]|nr:histidine phosphatase family protein [Candidatus Endonucleobacter sp. (ex Gigantidas childressi)]
MRHGQASYSVSPDRERPLSYEGRVQIVSVVQKILGEWPVSKVISSPYLRAWQTGSLVADVAGCEIESMDELIPDGDPHAVVHNLPEHCGCVLLSSHMPMVSKLAGLLCEGSVDCGPPFSVGAAALLELDFVAVGMSRLVKMILP